MDKNSQQQAIGELTKKKFHGRADLPSKYTPVFPAGIEREYSRVSRQYMRLLKESIEEELPALKKQIMMERGTYRGDGINDVMISLSRMVDQIQKKFEAKSEGYGLRRKLESLANMVRKLTVREWKKAVKSTLGINILEDYYMGDFYQTALDRWVNDNVNLIKTIPKETLGDMKKAVKDGFVNGKSTTRIMKEIQSRYNVSKNHAKFLAVDQIGKLNAAVTRAQQEDAGIEEYIWCDSGDGLVRKGHHALNGHKFKWSDPPVVDKKGRRCHPGEDYRCRCRAKPVFKFGVFNAPVTVEEERKRKGNA